MKPGAAAFALVLLATRPAIGAEALTFQPGGRIDITCQTQSVALAPTAASTSGTLRLRLDFAATAGDRIGTWTILEAASTHTASLAARHRGMCAGGCELALAAVTTPWPDFQLWAPKRAAPGSVGADEPLTVAILDARTLAFSASTFLAKEIAGLEKGSCKRD